MNRGIVFVASCGVSGLVVLDKSEIHKFETSMSSMEENGYRNVPHIKRCFAIELEGYEEKLGLLYEVFSKSRLGETALFALDVDLVIQLLSSFEGKQVFPKNEEKARVFSSATKHHYEREEVLNIPNGDYHLKQKARSNSGRPGAQADATMTVDHGVLTIKAGSKCYPKVGDTLDSEWRKKAVIVNGVLQEDVVCTLPSPAGEAVLGQPVDGWTAWKTSGGEPINIFRGVRRGK